ncbi:hypothetical protein LB506_000552 [Fusarium annulatum]|nr:hypothetical protein LB506_000552 [Fusarium annulatum]
MADNSSLAVAHKVPMVHVTKDRLQGHQGTNSSAHSCAGSDASASKGRTYVATITSIYVSEAKSSPHEEQHDNLPARVDEPLSKHGHKDCTQRVSSNEDNRHDDTVSSQNSLAGATATSVLCHGTARARTRVRVGIFVAVGEWVAVRTHCGFGKVNTEIHVLVVLRDALLHACRIQGISILPSCNPRARALETKVNTVVASNVGDHLLVLDSRTVEELESASLGVIGHYLSDTSPWAQGDIAVAVLVNDEHVRSGHLGSSA